MIQNLIDKVHKFIAPDIVRAELYDAKNSKHDRYALNIHFLNVVSNFILICVFRSGYETVFLENPLIQKIIHFFNHSSSEFPVLILCIISSIIVPAICSMVIKVLLQGASLQISRSNSRPNIPRRVKFLMCNSFINIFSAVLGFILSCAFFYSAFLIGIAFPHSIGIDKYPLIGWIQLYIIARLCAMGGLGIGGVFITLLSCRLH